MQVETDNIVLFWHNDSVFSNWYQPVKIMYHNIEFENSEALFIYFKAMYFQDEAAMAAVVTNQDPKTVKNIGRTIKGYNDDMWSKSRQHMMFQANLMKFYQPQNSELRQILLNTGDKILAEASPYDNIWGIGLRPDDPRALDKDNWYGQNLLGEVLMKVRSAIRNEQFGTVDV